jgi:hypothetical protein
VTESVVRAERAQAGAPSLEPNEKPLVFRSERNSSTLSVDNKGM